jgi:hypothetical protein
MCHLLDGLYDSLELNGIKIWIHISDHSIIRRPSIGRF